MNRALRRQQLKEPKPGAKARPGAQRAIPRTGPAPGAATRARTGLNRFVPRFISEVISELRKVVWPSRDDIVHLTVVICIVTVMIGAVLGVIDIAFGRLIDETLLRD
jgi:preprotein translocase subunit SecE